MTTETVTEQTSVDKKWVQQLLGSMTGDTYSSLGGNIQVQVLDVYPTVFVTIPSSKQCFIKGKAALVHELSLKLLAFAITHDSAEGSIITTGQKTHPIFIDG